MNHQSGAAAREVWHNMDFGTLTASLLFGSVGFGFLLYGKNAGQIAPIGVGLALMVCPYFIPNLAVLIIVCCILSAVPFFIRGG